MQLSHSGYFIASYLNLFVDNGLGAVYNQVPKAIAAFTPILKVNIAFLVPTIDKAVNCRSKKTAGR